MRFSHLVSTFAAGVFLACSTGCGAMSAITNPKAAWALQEPAPMAVILRRADAARATATNVDRLLGSTGVDATSRWIPKLALKKADVEAALQDIGTDPDYVVPKGVKIRVVQAEAWAKVLADLCPHETKFPSLVAEVSAELGTAYTDVASQAKKVAKLKADKAAEESALDASDISAADKETHEKKKREIEEQIDKTEDEYKPKVEAFMNKVRELAAKAPPEAKKQVPVALASLLKAVDDAKIANSVALLRYPMAMPGMPQELKTQAKRIVADVIEDKTGHRPNLDNFEPDAKLEGGSVKFTLNGLPPEAIARLKPDALLLEVTTRAKDYVVKVLMLTPTVAETQEMLDLESDTIKALMAGLSVEEGKVEGAGDDLADVKVEIDDAAAIAAANAGKGAVTAKGGKTSRRHPIGSSACASPANGGDKAKPKGNKPGAVAQAGDAHPAPAAPIR
jgi:hypothetical protein